MPNNKLQPLVSVVIPAYNSERWIEETLKSVLNQTYPNIEVIVVDDGSTDNTFSIVDKFKNRVKYLQKKNGGSASARNMGIRKSVGEWIALLDADDLWITDKIQTQMDYLKNHTDVYWVYSDAYIFSDKVAKDEYRIGSTTKMFSGDVLEPLIMEDFIPSPTPVINRKVFNDVGIFDESIKRSEDWDLWLRIAAHYKVGFVDKPLAKYRMHLLSKSSSIGPKFTLESRKKIINKAISDNKERLQKFHSQANTNLLFKYGQEMLKQGDISTSRTTFKKLLSYKNMNYRILLYLFATYVPQNIIRFLKTLNNKRRKYSYR